MRVAARPGSNPWSYAVRGVVAVLFGAAMLAMPGLGLASFIFVYGLFSLFDGVVAVIASFMGLHGRKVDWGQLLSGIAGVVLGLFFLFRPGISIGLLSIVVAVWFLATGLGTLLSAIEYRKRIQGEWLLGAAGVLTILFGVFLLARPIVAVALLPLMIGGYALLWGLLLLAAAFRLWRGRDAVPAA